MGNNCLVLGKSCLVKWKILPSIRGDEKGINDKGWGIGKCLGLARDMLRIG